MPGKKQNKDFLVCVRIIRCGEDEETRAPLFCLSVQLGSRRLWEEDVCENWMTKTEGNASPRVVCVCVLIRLVEVQIPPCFVGSSIHHAAKCTMSAVNGNEHGG